MDSESFIFATFENHKLVVAIDLRERLNESQNILTDTGLVIIDEARVDPDAHITTP